MIRHLLIFDFAHRHQSETLFADICSALSAEQVNHTVLAHGVILLTGAAAPESVRSALNANSLLPHGGSIPIFFCGITSQIAEAVLTAVGIESP